MRIRPAAQVAALLLLCVTPAWACGVGFGPEILLVILAFFGAEAFICALVAALLTRFVAKRTWTHPKTAIFAGVSMGTSCGPVCGIAGAVVGPGGMVAVTALASALIASVVVRLCGKALVSNIETVEAPSAHEPAPAALYEEGDQWRPLS